MYTSLTVAVTCHEEYLLSSLGSTTGSSIGSHTSHEVLKFDTISDRLASAHNYK